MVERLKGVDIPETINKFHNNASLLAAGRRILIDHLDEFPYYPHPEEFGNRIWQESGLDYWSVTADQKLQAALFTEQIMIPVLARVKEQQKYNIDPYHQKRNLIDTINNQIPEEVHLKAETTEVAWGIFSFSLVLPNKVYDKFVNYFTERKPDSIGTILSNLVGNLGPIPVVRKSREKRSILTHEDVHVFQMLIGAMDKNSSIEIFDDIDFFSALENKPNSGKLRKVEKIHNQVATAAHQSFENELRADIWNREKPGTGFVTDLSNPYVTWSLFALYNQIYSPTEHLTEREQIESIYSTQSSLNEIAYRREVIWNIVKASVKDHKDKPNTWEWVAANVTLIPQGSHLGLYKAVLLKDRHSLAANNIQRSVAADLAGALITHARRRTDPNSYGQGGEMPKHLLKEFLCEIERVFKEKNLYTNILSLHNLDTEYLKKVKQKLINYASKSVPPGYRGETNRHLQASLNV